MSETSQPLNFVLATWEGGGSVMPIVTAARKLVERGHRVRVLSDACNRLEVEAAGARFIPWNRAPSRPDRKRETCFFRDWEASTPEEQFGRVLDRIIAGPARAYAEDIIEQLGIEPADLVVSNEMLLGVALGCEAIAQPFALLTCNVSLFPLEGLPPLGPGLLPPRNAEEQALHAEIAEGNRAMFDSRLPAYNAARASFGLAPLATLAAQHEKAQRILLGTSAAFDFAPDELPPLYTYVGPQLDNPSWAAPWASPFAADDDRPLVLAGFSTTFQDHVAVLQRIIDAASTLDVRLLVTLGDTIAPDELTPAANCRLVHSAPHGEVMAEAAMVITHGGHGTVTRALVARRPLVVVPHGRDQNDNAVRVTARGAGLQLAADADAGAFRSAIETILGDPAYASAADRLGQAIAKDAECSPLVAELERLVLAPANGLRAA